MRRRFEAGLLLLAAWLLNRNVERSPVTSRRDNNWLFEAQYELRKVAQRILAEYR